MIDSRAQLSITRQCRLPELSRASHYRFRVPRRETETVLRRSLEAVYERHPYYGSRRMQLALRDRGLEVGLRRLRRLMRAMGLEPIHPKPRTSVKDPAHETYPYLLRRRRIEAPNAVWAADITSMPMRRGHVYRVAVMDWTSRRILSWRLSNTLDVSFCVVALNEALARHGCPTVFNTDQGSQFTSRAFLEVLRGHGIAISMDGKGCWRDNVMVERFWRSLKYECVHLHAFEDPREADARIAAWIEFYNHQRRHQGLANRTPDAVYHDASEPHQDAA